MLYYGICGVNGGKIYGYVVSGAAAEPHALAFRSDLAEVGI